MADLSVIPITRADLKLVEGERCLLDRRINTRLGYGRGTEVRDLIKRNRDDFEARFGPLRHRAVVVRRQQGGGSTETEYWLTKGQALWVCRKSDARNADDVMEEVIKAFLAIDAGSPIPNTPWTDALLAPDRPTVSRRETNVIHVEHEDWTQPELFASPAPSAAADAHLNAIAGPPSKPSFYEAEWQEREAGINYSVIKCARRNGAPMSLFFSRPGILHVATEAVFWVPDPSGNGDQIGLYLNHVIPLAVVERAVDRLGIGPMSELTHKTLRHYLAF